MSTVIDYLRKFNRKERFHLVKWAIGTFDLSDDCRADLKKATGLDIPSDAFVAMDYHINWLYAAVYLGGKRGLSDKTGVYPNPELEGVPGTRMVQGNQEDVDLLIAYEGEGVTHIVMVEAKGDSAWSNTQMKSKARRLEEIFQAADASVWPHLVFASPRPPSQLNYDAWPSWTKPEKPDWTCLPWPTDLEAVFRCDEAGKKSSRGEHWTVGAK